MSRLGFLAHYPVRGVSPTRSLYDTRDNYLHVLTSISEGESTAKLIARPDNGIMPGSHVNSRVFVPSPRGTPSLAAIQADQPSEAELILLSDLTAAEGIRWRQYAGTCHGLAVIMVEPTVHLVDCETMQGSRVLFEAVSSQAIVLAALRSMFELRPLHPAS